MNTEIE
jgi:hypothetical protein